MGHSWTGEGEEGCSLQVAVLQDTLNGFVDAVLEYSRLAWQACHCPVLCQISACLLSSRLPILLSLSVSMLNWKLFPERTYSDPGV